MDFRHAKRFLKESKAYLITTHVHADGDAIASILALRGIVESVGARARIVLHDRRVDGKYRFLDGFGRIQPYSPSVFRRPLGHLIVADTPSVVRIGDVGGVIHEKTRILNIDHHESNSCFGDVNLVDREACATSEIVFGLGRALRVRVDADMATQLYTGIMFDTGRFRYSSLHRAFPTGAALVALGADAQGAAEAVYGHRSYRSTRALGQALCSLELHFTGRAATLVLPYASLKEADDLDGIVDHAMSVPGVEVAALLKEEKPNRFRVSLRSRGHFDVNALARDFNGGGHPNAAGCQVEGDTKSVKRALLRSIGRRISRSR